MQILLILLLLLAFPAHAGDYTLTLSGDSSAACTISFSTEAESLDGTYPLQNGDITAFSCTITEANPDLVLGLGDLQYPAGLDYRVSGGKVTALDLQTTTANQLQIGNATAGYIDNRWYTFGSGTVLVSDSNRVAIAEAGSGLTLAQQAATMSAGEWLKLDTANIFVDVGHTAQELADITTAGGGFDISYLGGPSTNLILAWNSSVYDPTGNRMFFWGGGHGDYGGNEVYEFDFDTLTWTRLTSAAALSTTISPGGEPVRYLPEDLSPVDGIPDTPAVPHTYDALWWNSTVNELFVLQQASVYPYGNWDSATDRHYAFDPATLTWTPYVGHDYFIGTCVYVPAGNEALCYDQIGYTSSRLYAVADNGTETDCGAKTTGFVDYYAQALLDPYDNSVYAIYRSGIHEITPAGCSSTVALGAAKPASTDLGIPFDFTEGGWTGGGDGYLYGFDGTERMVKYDTVGKTFEVLWNENYRGTGPNKPFPDRFGGRVFGKVHWFNTEGVFALYANPDDDTDARAGWWLYKPGPNPAEINQAKLGTLVSDGETQSSISVFLPVLLGGRNYNSTATLQYRLDGAGTWIDGIQLMRTRPEFDVPSRAGVPVNQDGFYGMVTGLTPNTAYEIQVTVTEPDGLATGSAAAQQVLDPISTAPIPLSSYGSLGSTVISSNDTGANLTTLIQAQCDGAGTGHVFTIAAGVTITGAVEVGRPAQAPGTCGADANNPIVLRGESNTTSVIDCTGLVAGTCIRIAGGYVTVENLKIEGGGVIYDAIWVYGYTGGRIVDNVTVRENVIDGITVSGIAFAGYGENHYIADNDITGPEPFGSDTVGGGVRCIEIIGSQIEVEHNTVAGCIDGIATNWNVTNYNRAIVVHHNVIKWGADDGIEFDFVHRNMTAHHNLVANTADCLSFQPVQGGPVWALRNICYNMLRGAVKIKEDGDFPDGVHIFNNTMIVSGDVAKGYPGANYFNYGPLQVTGTDIRNNIFCGHTLQSGYALFDNGNFESEANVLDYNALCYTTGGFLTYGDKTSTSFATWVSAGGNGANDVDLTADFGAGTVFNTLNPDNTAIWGDHYRDPLGKVYTLHPSSDAVDAGVPITGVTSAGDANPNMGACETGECDSTGTFYGVR